MLTLTLFIGVLARSSGTQQSTILYSFTISCFFPPPLELAGCNRHSLLQDGLARVRVSSGAKVVDDNALRPGVVQVTATLKELVLIRDSPVLEVKPEEERKASSDKE